MSDDQSVSVSVTPVITSCHLHLVTVLQPTHLNTRSTALAALDLLINALCH